jgi:hypothetical protein
MSTTDEQHQPATTASAGPGAGDVATGAAPADTAPGARRRIRIASPAALAAIVPSVLGFRPEKSLVVIGTEPTAPSRGEVKVALRYDLPDPSGDPSAADIAGHAAGVLGAQHIQAAVAVGYGPGELVTPLVDALRETAAGADIRLTEILRVQDGRYWSYLCTDPACCPPDGTPFGEHADGEALAALPDARTRVLGSREELAATVAADGEAAESMRTATRRAEEHAARLIARIARAGRRSSARRAVADAGLHAVSDAIARYRDGGQIQSADDAAWLTLVLRDLRVRDDAWSRMDPAHSEAHLRMWTGITRLAQPGYVAAPASLLAFVAWQSGNGALANVALDRALADDPHYSMADLLRQVIDSGAPPSMARLPMTPEEVAASYDESDECADSENDREPDCEDDQASRPDEPEGQDAGDSRGAVAEKAAESA